MEWIYLSPHLDDVALSCGGLLWEQTHLGENVSIWTVCAGDPPAQPFSPLAQSLHTRWQTGSEAVAQRREEDRLACRALEATYRHFSVPDCIYRRSPVDGKPLYPTEESLFASLHPDEQSLVAELSGLLASTMPPSARVVCPLGVGGHVDHQLTRAAVERLFVGNISGSEWSLAYYADYPYVREPEGRAGLPEGKGWEVQTLPVSPVGLSAWGKAVSAYGSQISTFWPDLDAMQAALSDYSQEAGGVRLWMKSSLEQAF